MTNRMWGGRFVSGPAAIMEEINASIGFDKRLAPHDIRGSLAHAAMLGAAGILPREDVTAIERGLKAIAAEIESGAFTFSLPIEAPVRTAYVAGAPTLTFAPDTLALGLYTIEATSAGAIQSAAMDTKAAVAPLTFAFP